MKIKTTNIIKIITDPEPSQILGTLTNNISDIKDTDIKTVIGTDEEISRIEKENLFNNHDCAIAFTDTDIIKDRSGFVAEHTSISSAEAIWFTEYINNQTDKQASELYQTLPIQKLQLPSKYRIFKKQLLKNVTREQCKFAKIAHLLKLSEYEFKHVFKFKTTNQKN